MKFTTLAVAALAGLNFSPAAASFFIYWSQDPVSGTGAYLYYFFRGHPSCNDVINARAYTESDDVSRIQGVVCDGAGCSNGKFEEVKRLEMNTDFGHYTIYKDRGFGLFDTRDRNLGSCRPTREHSFTCGAPFSMSGITMFYCDSSVNP
ncbi:hypothetical protein B0T14DRAFT_441850 [Immersiella caudata]|uniref:Uncharacterized protein n=1 Tax=Immersiella caudata TaxID=314043 RepID=A0AA39TLG0_9PEZI|nr:hypothetical protein B0T14DRAFT_441850 [Immersiella caudata]